jgi:hypothetical protein
LNAPKGQKGAPIALQRRASLTCELLLVDSDVEFALWWGAPRR